jgi:hypothetical protein
MARGASLPSPKEAVRLLTAADLRAVGLEPMLPEPKVTVGPDRVWLSYSMEAGADGGIELGLFDLGDYAETNFELNAGSGSATAVPGADHAIIEEAEFDAQPYRMLTVWRGRHSFNLYVPNSLRAIQQLVSLGALVIQRLYK